MWSKIKPNKVAWDVPEGLGMEGETEWETGKLKDWEVFQQNGGWKDRTVMLQNYDATKTYRPSYRMSIYQNDGMEDNYQLQLKRSVNAESGRKSKTVSNYIFDTCSDCLNSSYLCTVRLICFWESGEEFL